MTVEAHVSAEDHSSRLRSISCESSIYLRTIHSQIGEWPALRGDFEP